MFFDVNHAMCPFLTFFVVKIKRYCIHLHRSKKKMISRFEWFHTESSGDPCSNNCPGLEGGKSTF